MHYSGFFAGFCMFFEAVFGQFGREAGVPDSILGYMYDDSVTI
jgi:hypothetical protein